MTESHRVTARGPAGRPWLRMKRRDEKREAPHVDLLLINPAGRKLICHDLAAGLAAAELEREG